MEILDQQNHEEPIKYTGDAILYKGELEEAESKIKNASVTLYVIAIFTLILAIVSGIREKELLQIYPFAYHLMNGINAFLIIVFLICGWFAKKYPMASLLTGLLVYLGIHILNAVLDPTTLAQGIIFKIIIISFLVNGVVSASRVEKIRKKLNDWEANEIIKRREMLKEKE